MSDIKYYLNDPQVWRDMPDDDFDKIMREGINLNIGKQAFQFKEKSNPFREAKLKASGKDEEVNNDGKIVVPNT